MKNLIILPVNVMKANFKLLVTLVLIAVLLVSCSVSDPVEPVDAYQSIPGCLDPTALNYDALANTNDGSCVYSDNSN